MAVLIINKLECVKSADAWVSDRVTVLAYTDSNSETPELLGKDKPFELDNGQSLDNLDLRISFANWVRIELLEHDHLLSNELLGQAIFYANPHKGLVREIRNDDGAQYILYCDIEVLESERVAMAADEKPAEILMPSPDQRPKTYKSGYFLDKENRVPLLVEIGAHGLGARVKEIEKLLFGLEPINTVKGVQQRLNDLNYNAGKIDGHLGKHDSKTRTALRNFQSDQKIPQTGDTDSVTLEHLGNAHDYKGTISADKRVDDAIYVPEGFKLKLPPPKQAKREHRDSPDTSSFNGRGVVEFITFGKSHRYYVEDYMRYAPGYQAALIREARVLVSSLNFDLAILYDMAADGSLGAWMTNVMDDAWRKAVETWRQHPIKLPDTKDYDKLINDAFAIWSKVKNATPDQYGVLHKAGLDFMGIRWKQSQLKQRVQERIENLIHTAEVGEKAATEVENTAFTILDLYGQARFSQNPWQLAAYRVSILVVRASARGIGEKLAENSNHTIYTNVVAVVKPELVNIFTDLAQGLLKQKKFKDKDNPTPTEEFMSFLLGLGLFTFFEILDFKIFQEPNLTAEEKKDPMGKFWDGFAPKLLTECIKGYLNVRWAGVKSGLDPVRDKWRIYWTSKALVAVATILSTSLKEYDTIAQTAEKENREKWDVLFSDMGWIVARMAKAVATELAKASVQDWMKSKLATEKTFREHISQIIDSVRALWKVGTAPPPTNSAPPPAKSQIGQPLPPPTSGGPDKDGNIGANKHPPAILQSQETRAKPVAGEMASKNPDKDAREAVKVTEQQTPPIDVEKATVVVDKPADGPQELKEREQKLLLAKNPPHPDDKPSPEAVERIEKRRQADEEKLAKQSDKPIELPEHFPTPKEMEQLRKEALREDAKRERWRKLEEAKYGKKRQGKPQPMPEEQKVKVPQDKILDKKDPKYRANREELAKIWLERSRPKAIGGNDIEVRKALGFEDPTKREGLIEAAKAELKKGPVQYEIDPKNPICADIIIPAPGRKLTIAESKGTDMNHAIAQMVSAYGMYKKSSGTKPKQVEFFYIIPAGDSPVSGEFHVKEGRVFKDVAEVKIDGFPIRVVALQEVPE